MKSVEKLSIQGITSADGKPLYAEQVSVESVEEFKKLFAHNLSDEQRKEYVNFYSKRNDVMAEISKEVYGNIPISSNEAKAFVKTLFPVRVVKIKGSEIIFSEDVVVGPKGMPYYIDADTLRFNGGSLTAITTVLSIKAKELIIEGDKVSKHNYHIGIMGEEGEEGEPGRNGRIYPPAANGASRDPIGAGVCPKDPGGNGLNGVNGEIGGNGDTGNDGYPNLPATITVQTMQTEKPFVVFTHSGSGGKGGDGGHGGPGQQGGMGGYGCYSGCEGTDGGNGGNGGDGANGGYGGDGGNGADGDPINITAPSSAKSIIQIISTPSKSGKAGKGGLAGDGGNGGQAGPGGKHCGPGTTGNPGKLAIDGKKGSPGSRDGSPGPVIFHWM